MIPGDDPVHQKPLKVIAVETLNKSVGNCLFSWVVQVKLHDLHDGLLPRRLDTYRISFLFSSSSRLAKRGANSMFGK
jgi:hypothetical protein